ncbi:MAG: DegT/DnrJ/EryC1/StrS family aminotransferase [Fibrobacteraceae bacterium]|nr:DegT/DnrJ/EryC1/StrS family aminotransferase [Fibrobacteraceae bacterium]
MIPFVNLNAQRRAYKGEIDSAISNVLDSACYIGGEVVSSLEKELSDYTRIPYTITCASGTSALILALMALGISKGDEVIVPDFTFIATAEAVVLLGGIPRFADIEKNYLISPKSAANLISSKTKGIIAVDLFGQMANYAQLKEIADAHGLWILEDAAQSFGASQNGNFAGSVATIAATSFYPTKPLGCYGDGGAVFTHSKSIANKVRELSNHGSSGRYKHSEIGLNSRLDTLQAAILEVKLRHFPEELAKREKNAVIYNNYFKSIEDVIVPEISNRNTSTYAQYTLQFKNRSKWMKILKRSGIPTCIHYPQPLSSQICFANLPSASQDGRSNTCARQLSREVLSLPVCAFTDAEEIIERIQN